MAISNTYRLDVRYYPGSFTEDFVLIYSVSISSVQYAALDNGTKLLTLEVTGNVAGVDQAPVLFSINPDV